MTIQQFAEKNRLKTRRDECDDVIIPGRGGQIYQYSPQDLAVMFITPASEPPRTHFWRKMSAACISAGLTLRQGGDAEGTLTFDADNGEHVRLALKLAGVRCKRRMSDEQRAKMSVVLATARKTSRRPLAGSPSSDLETTVGSQMDLCPPGGREVITSEWLPTEDVSSKCS